MNIETGKLVPSEMLEKMFPAEQAKYVEVKRDLSALEEMNMQIRLYAPCGCGSGKKFKFCCHKNP